MAESMLSSKDWANASVRSLALVMMERANASIHVGNVSLSPTHGGNELQFAISQKIGVPPCHVTSFLVRDRQSRIPLDENTDLTIVLRETADWYVLAKVPVWRARNGRKRRSQQYTVNPRRTVCAECEAAEDLGVKAGFHRCIKDVVVQAGSLVRSPAGPIERPSRSCVEAY